MYNNNNFAYATLANFGQSPSQISVTRAAQLKIPGAQCVSQRPQMFPLNNWAANKAEQPLMNIDGELIPSNTCLYRCNNTGNNQLVVTPFQPKNSYYLPGGVVSAVRFFKQCA